MVQIKVNNKVLDLKIISINYIKFKLSLEGINTFEGEKSLEIELLTNSLQKLKVISSVMAEHRTIKNEIEYNYNFWEFKIPENDNYDFLVCVLFEKIENELKINGYFIFPKNELKSVNKNSTLNIFESDISGNYKKEPKINKFNFFKNWRILLKD